MPSNEDFTQWLDRGKKTDNTSSCQATTQPGDLSDGFLTGRLSTNQASVFLDYIKKKSGLISVDGLNLISRNGRQLLHFTADLKPVAYGGNQGNPGLRSKNLAIRLRPLGGPFDGYHMEY